VEKFRTGDLGLDVATYTDPEVAPYRVGLIGMVSGSVRNSFAFRADEWTRLIALAAQAAQPQSSGAWRVVGEMTETGTSDVGHLVVSAGPGIRFALSSPKGAALTYVVARSDIPRFQQALGKVKAYLAAAAPAQGGAAEPGVGGK
jgi:hypothetical protein